MKRVLGMMLVAYFALVPNAFAAGMVETSIVAEKEMVVEEQGKKVIKRVPATYVAPGDIVFYTLHFVNKGNKAAMNVVLVDPIPENTAYVNGSVFGPSTEITFSIDQGKSYKKPSILTYVVKGKKLVASPDAYTHIRWIVKELGAGKSGTVGFQVKVK